MWERFPYTPVDGAEQAPVSDIEEGLRTRGEGAVEGLLRGTTGTPGLTDEYWLGQIKRTLLTSENDSRGLDTQTHSSPTGRGVPPTSKYTDHRKGRSGGLLGWWTWPMKPFHEYRRWSMDGRVHCLYKLVPSRKRCQADGKTPVFL